MRKFSFSTTFYKRSFIKKFIIRNLHSFSDNFIEKKTAIRDFFLNIFFVNRERNNFY